MLLNYCIFNLLTPHIFPKSLLEFTNTYGTFLSSHSNGKCNKISNGSASAAMTINSARPRFKAFVAGQEESLRNLTISSH